MLGRAACSPGLVGSSDIFEATKKRLKSQFHILIVSGLEEGIGAEEQQQRLVAVKVEMKV